MKVKSIYLHDVRRVLRDKVSEGESGWVLQGIISRASFRRQPLSGQKSFTVMSLHINNSFAKKRGIGKKLVLTTRAVMREFNGAACRRDACPIPHEALGIRQTDQSCHHEVWLHLDFVEQRNGQAHHERHQERRLLLKERSAPNHYNKPKYPTGGDASDYSLSS